MSDPCTREGHEVDKLHWSQRLVRQRRWTDAGLELADCPKCNSTLGRDLLVGNPPGVPQ